MRETKLQYPKKNPYEYADKVVRYLTKRSIRMFTSARLLPFDELNVLHGTRDIYNELYGIIKTMFLRLARHVYAEQRALSTHSREVERKIDEKTVEGYLTAYNPVTRTVFRNDLDRYAALYAEAVLATKDVDAERERALRTLVRRLREESIIVTDNTAVKAYKDAGVEKVMWLTRQDERRCAECKDRHGEIYEIDELPPKPHRNCRCWWVPYPFKEE